LGNSSTPFEPQARPVEGSSSPLAGPRSRPLGGSSTPPEPFPQHPAGGASSPPIGGQQQHTPGGDRRMHAGHEQRPAGAPGSPIGGSSNPLEPLRSSSTPLAELQARPLGSSSNTPWAVTARTPPHHRVGITACAQGMNSRWNSAFSGGNAGTGWVHPHRRPAKSTSAVTRLHVPLQDIGSCHSDRNGATTGRLRQRYVCRTAAASRQTGGSTPATHHGLDHRRAAAAPRTRHATHLLYSSGRGTHRNEFAPHNSPPQDPLP